MCMYLIGITNQKGTWLNGRDRNLATSIATILCSPSVPFIKTKTPKVFHFYTNRNLDNYLYTTFIELNVIEFISNLHTTLYYTHPNKIYSCHKTTHFIVHFTIGFFIYESRIILTFSALEEHPLFHDTSKGVGKSRLAEANHYWENETDYFN